MTINQKNLKEALPAIFRLISDCERNISILIGGPICLQMKLPQDEINDTILEEIICKVFGITWADMRSRCRRRDLTIARQVYIYYAYNVMGGHTFQSIAKRLNRHHSSVINLHKGINDMIATNDKPFLIKLNQVELIIKQGIDATNN